jgi:N-acetylmuramoyl-L-alanine amidase
MMKRKAWLFILVGACISITAFTPHTGRQKPTLLRTIIVDAGHGGLDPGTHGLISKEKEITLDIALKLGDAIKKEFPDIKIIYTRTTDILPGNASTLGQGLINRADMANRARGDLFVSIHCNSDGHPAGGWYAKRVIGHKKVMRYVGKGKKKKKRLVTEPIFESYWVKNTRIGTETYIWKADRSGFKGQAISEKDEGGEGEDMGDSTNSVFEMSSPEATIRAQLYEKKYFEKSATLASYVEDEFQKTGRISYGVKQRDKGIRVLQATGMPSILVETGFLTNKEEEEYLNSEKGQDEVVDNIIIALRKYKEEVEGGTRSTGRNDNGGRK